MESIDPSYHSLWKKDKVNINLANISTLTCQMYNMKDKERTKLYFYVHVVLILHTLHFDELKLKYLLN